MDATPPTDSGLSSIAAIDQAALASCSREPIHIPGAIQPHGVLLSLKTPGLECVQCSANTASVFGLEPAQILGKSLAALPGDDATPVIAACQEEDPQVVSPVEVTIRGEKYHCILHRQEGLVLVELEHAAEEMLALPRKLQRAFADSRAARDLPELYQRMARFVSELTGFERVMVYRFDVDWHGEVVGEHLSALVDTYMGHHFPASDIPEQARALYRKNWLRIIPDATYKAVPLEPPMNPLTGRPLDLTFSVLRSVSPIHLQYLINMDVRASMSISILVEDRLWGLIACHHRTPLHLPYAIRSACEMYGQVSSLEIAARQEHARLELHYEAVRIQTSFFDFIAREPSFVEALVKYTPQLLDFMKAGGAAILVNGKLTLLGKTPPQETVKALAQWLEQGGHPTIFSTDELRSVWSPAESCPDTASGLLAVKLSRVEPHYVLWFRPEVVTTVTWAGNPWKPTTGDMSLHPRKSFAAWKQKVTGRSLPWTEAERHGASELRTAINALVLRRTERLIKVNGDLERKNTDLNSFAYIASHDLREPLRGIANYARFILEDEKDQITGETIRKLDKISSLAVQSEELLEALNHYSKLGRIEIRRKVANLDEIVDQVAVALAGSFQERGAELKRPHPLPRVSCDPVLVREVLSNLISNALRYNTKATKWVEVGMREPAEADGPPVFYVRDNGIGIREKHFDSVFQIFRRLHPDNRYGKGTGAGLAIVRSIVEKHGGKVWVESVPDEGSAFCFTLSS